ncbi:hypothetical protein BH20ACT23_BH20ACT23_02550 [soil metagenome]
MLGALAGSLMIATTLFLGLGREDPPASETKHEPFDPGPKDAPPVECHGWRVAATSDIQQRIDQHEEGSTFCLEEGTYRLVSSIQPPDGTHLVGAGMDKTRLVGTGAEIIIDAKDSADVLIAHVDISGARGTQACKPSCGSGLRGGPNNTFKFVRVHDNANHGIGGSGDSLLIENSEIYGNGSNEFLGCCAGGVKSGNSFTINNSLVHDNNGSGIWCDVGCPRFVVQDNVVIDNTKNGVRFEHGGNTPDSVVAASSALIVRNRVQGNNSSHGYPGAGIEVNSASNAEVAFNILGDTPDGTGISVRGSRYPTVNIVIHDNVMNDDRVNGCHLRGVACTRNQ